MQVNSATIQKSFFDLKQVIATLDTSSVSQAEIDVILSRIEELHTYLLNRDELFLKILKKSKTRSINDSKVAPGSNAVQRSFSDDRFLLCHVAVFRSRVHQKLNDLEGALSSLSEALLWFPRSLESLQRYTTLLKTKAGSPEELDVLETILRRAVAAFDQLRQAASGTVERSILADELEHGRTATESLCLLLSQRGNEAEANELMQRLGFTWRLSQQVIHYPLHVPSSAFSSASASATPCPVAYAIDGAVSQTQLRHLRSLFRSNSPFWSEHDYDALVSNCSRRVGYFSYLYPFRERAAACSLERVINRVFQAVCERFPGVAEGAQVAEWWVHSRVHSSGHQLHFDSDETSIEDGGAPHHPLVSCVLFLDADVGGPTLVTDQLLCDDHLANQGWLFYGHENRLVMFDAKYLHGKLQTCNKEHIMLFQLFKRLEYSFDAWQVLFRVEGPRPTVASAD